MMHPPRKDPEQQGCEQRKDKIQTPALEEELKDILNRFSDRALLRKPAIELLPGNAELGGNILLP